VHLVYVSCFLKITPVKAYFWISKLMLSTERIEAVLYLELEIDTKVKTIRSFNYNGQLVKD
jgi:hypothetical protein